MNIKRFLLAWHFFAITFSIIFVAFFAIVPELELFRYLAKRYGFIDLELWDLCYALAALLITALLNSLLMYSVLRFFNRAKEG